MHGNAIPRVKQVIRANTLTNCEILAAAALAAESADEVREILTAVM
jgi:phosphoenolpyruvate-protein kinase (PTS system EI component)